MDTDSEVYILESINITAFLKAKRAFEEGLAQLETVWTRDATIKRFEFSFELTWKVLKRILAKKGIEVNSPRETFRFAAKEGLIDDPAQWFRFLEDRNLASHTYNEQMAEGLYAKLPAFLEALEKLIQKITKL